MNKIRLFNNLSQIPGWHTKRKIIVIESDDWGCIRMKSKETIRNFSKKGIFIDDPYNLNDSLASETDLTYLFEILSSFKDINNNHPVITANTIVANPDFKKIRESEFTEYHYEIFTKTLQKYSNHKNSFSLWKEGINSHIFKPQYHGREHVNIFRWLRDLKKNDTKARIGFNNEIFGLVDKNTSDIRNSYMRALDFQSKEELIILERNLSEGIKIFNTIFGYNSKSFIAPSYVWNSSIEDILSRKGIKYLQGIQYQYAPDMGKHKYKRILHFSGQRNRLNQLYLVRNVFFEPSLTNKNKSIDEALKRISIAFRWKKPVIIGSHRLNYIGYINPKNRDENLKLLESLLKRIIFKWPEVEFMSSDQLGDIIQKREM